MGLSRRWGQKKQTSPPPAWPAFLHSDVMPETLNFNPHHFHQIGVHGDCDCVSNMPGVHCSQVLLGLRFPLIIDSRITTDEINPALWFDNYPKATRQQKCT